ncbi:phage virion morphogenesis protein [Mucilaginibacter sp.]|uniref:phage virion morphogenesis protein n=1 Tax=Mucilaginibacter sp. TaxID=1882438 RepID=UPI003265ED50
MSQGQVNDVFAKIRERLNQAIEKLPLTIGNEAVNYSLDAFRNQAWEGKPWAARKSKKDAGRSILVKSGRGRRSIRVISTTANSVRFGTDVLYMVAHNNGAQISRAARSETFVRNRYTKGPKSKMFGGMGAFKKGTTAGEGLTFKASSFNLPQRQFIGKTAAFETAMRNVVKREIAKALGL